MNGARRWLAPVFLGLVLLGELSWLFKLRLGGGDVYPPYSSLRADALGTRALFEAWAQLPGFTVTRDYHPLERLSARPRLVVMPGLAWQDWQEVPAADLAKFQAIAASGGRVVLAFRADQKRERRDEHGRPIAEDEASGKGDRAADAPSKKKPAAKSMRKLPGTRERTMKKLGDEWGVAFKQRWLVDKNAAPHLADAMLPGFEPQIEWHSDLYFTPMAGSAWRAVYYRAGEAVLVERPLGRGSIVLLADAFALSNEALHRARAPALLTWLAGDQRDVEFLEGTLGVLEETGVGSLARRYGLGGAMVVAVVLGGLYAWRRVVTFVPPVAGVSATGETLLRYEPAAGMTALLRRSLGNEALPSCVDEWRKSQRAGQLAAKRLESAWQARPAESGTDSRQTYNSLVRALKPR